MKKYLASLLILILSFSSTLAIQAYQEDVATELYIQEHFEFGGVNVWSGVTEDGVQFRATDGVYVKSGVTECGLEFRAYKASEFANIAPHQIGDSRPVEVTITFPGSNVSPPRSIMWTETFQNRTWSGTLQLTMYMNIFSLNETWGTYRGVVWAAN